MIVSKAGINAFNTGVTVLSIIGTRTLRTESSIPDKPSAIDVNTLPTASSIGLIVRLIKLNILLIGLSNI